MWWAGLLFTSFYRDCLFPGKAKWSSTVTLGSNFPGSSSSQEGPSLPEPKARLSWLLPTQHQVLQPADPDSQYRVEYLCKNYIKESK